MLMNSIVTELLSRTNALLPKRKPRGRTGGPNAYSAAQYVWAKGDMALFGDALNLRDKRVLDAGCGPGGKTVFFSEMGPREIVGVDSERSSIDAARTYAASRDASGVRFEVARLESLPFEDSEFDVMLMTDVLEHVSRPLLPSVMGEARRVLRPGGELALYFPPWTSFDASHLYDKIHIPWCQTLFGDDTLIALLRRAHGGDDASLERTITHYRALNRLTIQEFDKLVEESGLELRFHRAHMIKGMQLPQSLPLSEYLVKRVVAILRKPV